MIYYVQTKSSFYEIFSYMKYYTKLSISQAELQACNFVKFIIFGKFNKKFRKRI